MISGAFRNYDFSKLSMKVDRRGFLVGTSRLGYHKLGPGSGMVEILPGFTGISLNQSMNVEDGMYLSTSVSTLTLTSNDKSLFNTYDGEHVILTYNGNTLLDGYVEDSSLEATIDPKSKKEEVAVTVTCRSFDAAAFQAPPLYGSLSVYGSPESPEDTYTTARPAERVIDRAAAITGEVISYEDSLARVLLDEGVGAATTLEGSQGTILQDLANRAGVLVDMNGLQPSFRSYQSVPVWNLTDSDITSYGLEKDHESPTAVIFSKTESDVIKVAYQGKGDILLAKKVSTSDAGKWGLMTAAAVAPIKKTNDVFVTSFNVGFKESYPIFGRLPLRASFTHGTSTYWGSVIGLSHSITPLGWYLTVDCAPNHLVTRVSDVTPDIPGAPTATGAAGGFTASWVSVPGATKYTVHYRLVGDGSRAQVNPVDGLSSSFVTVSTNTATVTGLAAGTYFVTVFAYYPDQYRSAPSRALTVVTT